MDTPDWIQRWKKICLYRKLNKFSFWCWMHRKTIYIVVIYTLIIAYEDSECFPTFNRECCWEVGSTIIPPYHDALSFCPLQVLRQLGWMVRPGPGVPWSPAPHCAGRQRWLSTLRSRTGQGSACTEIHCKWKAGCSWTFTALHLTSAAEWGIEPHFYPRPAIIHLSLQYQHFFLVKYN